MNMRDTQTVVKLKKVPRWVYPGAVTLGKVTKTPLDSLRKRYKIIVK